MNVRVDLRDDGMCHYSALLENKGKYHDKVLTVEIQVESLKWYIDSVVDDRISFSLVQRYL